MNKIDKTCKYNWLGKTILIVEDDEACVYLLKEYFYNTHVQFIHTHSGLEAIKLCWQCETHIDLIIMDLKLSDISGLKAARVIKSFRNIPIIAYTAMATSEDKQNCLQTGCDGYITKPIDFVIATEIINNLLFKELHAE